MIRSLLLALLLLASGCASGQAVLIRTATSEGTGWLIEDAEHVITVRHVVHDEPTVTIYTRRGPVHARVFARGPGFAFACLNSWHEHDVRHGDSGSAAFQDGNYMGALEALLIKEEDVHDTSH